VPDQYGGGLGDAFLAAQAVGAVGAADIDLWNPPEAGVTAVVHPEYERLYPLFQRLYRQTKDIAAERADALRADAPHQIRDAIARNLPVVLPLGVMEHHGEHLPVGMDTLAVTRALDRLEEVVEVVILPAFPYGAASHAVAGPVGTGTLHIPSEALVPLAEAVFAALLRAGWRNVHAVIHHQTEDFGQGMPTDLAFRLGARQAIFAAVEAERGEGWWGAEAMRRYYEGGGMDPFRWIRVHPLLPLGSRAAYPFDHAGEGETGLMLALAPEAVELDRLGENRGWWTETAPLASVEKGEEGVRIILAHLRECLGV
jgi:creatinine amidohydrolase/Fe(II)-dependent formamide hydrolase-like protein